MKAEWRKWRGGRAAGGDWRHVVTILITTLINILFTVLVSILITTLVDILAVVGNVTTVECEQENAKKMSPFLFPCSPLSASFLSFVGRWKDFWQT